MKFGKVDINTTSPSVKWKDWTWKEFQNFYDHSLKGNVTETIEEIGKALGVKVPKSKKGSDA
jgi:hypothetical protein